MYIYGYGNYTDDHMMVFVLATHICGAFSLSPFSEADIGEKVSNTGPT